jgi:methionyl aminopeptidase
VTIRTSDELRKLRRAGRVVAEMHAAIREALRPGVTGLELDRLAAGVIERRGATSNFLGYMGYPNTIQVSPNSVVVHGIPDDTPLEEGDIVSFDCGAIVDGYHGDAAFSAGVGAVSAEAQRLVDVTLAALEDGIATLAPGSRLGDLGHAVESRATAAGYSVVRGYVGHGIGTAMHEQPDVPNYGRRGKGYRVSRGEVFAVEPMVCAGSARVTVDADGWTVRTRDGSLAAHWEHTVAVTDHGPEVLTKL